MPDRERFFPIRFLCKKKEKCLLIALFCGFFVRKQNAEKDQHGENRRNAQPDADVVRNQSHERGSEGATDVAREGKHAEHLGSALGESFACKRIDSGPHNPDEESPAGDPDQRELRQGRKRGEQIGGKQKNGEDGDRFFQIDLVSQNAVHRTGNRHAERKQTSSENIADRFARKRKSDFGKVRSPLGDRLFRRACRSHQDQKDEKPFHAENGTVRGGIFVSFERFDRADRKENGVYRRQDRKQHREKPPGGDADRVEIQGRKKYDENVPPAVKGVQHAHRPRFVA